MPKIVNLFDALFTQSECSTAFQSSRHVQYVRDRYDWEGITLFTDGYMYDGWPGQVKSTHKVGWLREPRCLWPQLYYKVGEVLDRFDRILTYDADLIEAFPDKCQFVPYGGVWIQREYWGLRPKTKLVSMLYGAKETTEGHKLRHELGKAIVKEFEDDTVDFYGVRGTPVDYSPATKLRVLGDYMFSVVVETCREDNLFTEILLDCFAVGTIPIFWGAPNVRSFFGPLNGILSFSTINQCLDIIDSIGPDLYEKMKAAAEQNLKLVAQYVTAEDWMFENGRLSFES